MGTRGVSGSGSLMSISVIISSHDMVTIDLYSMGESIDAESIPLSETYLRIIDHVSKF
jgi:hypothetical protein